MSSLSPFMWKKAGCLSSNSRLCKDFSSSFFPFLLWYIVFKQILFSFENLKSVEVNSSKCIYSTTFCDLSFWVPIYIFICENWCQFLVWHSSHLSYILGWKWPLVTDLICLLHFICMHKKNGLHFQIYLPAFKGFFLYVWLMILIATGWDCLWSSDYFINQSFEQ